MSSRSESHIVVLKCATSGRDRTAESFLAKITRKDSGSVEITATDGDLIYATHLSGSDIASLQKRPNSRNGWHTLFFSIITNRPVDGKSYETLVSRSPGKIAAVLRDVSNATPLKVAVLDIPAVDDAELNLFDWTVEATEAIQALYATDQRMRLELDKVERDKADLRKQLSDLRTAKLQHENQMLESFAKLLNAKKAHIRELRETSRNPEVGLKSTRQYSEGKDQGMNLTDHQKMNSRSSSTNEASGDEDGESDEMRDISPARASTNSVNQSDEGEDEEL